MMTGPAPAMPCSDHDAQQQRCAAALNSSSIRTGKHDMQIKDLVGPIAGAASILLAHSASAAKECAPCGQPEGVLS
jgi:hypothetical protein